jgi:hypothetical protein
VLAGNLHGIVSQKIVFFTAVELKKSIDKEDKKRIKLAQNKDEM